MTALEVLDEGYYEDRVFVGKVTVTVPTLFVRCWFQGSAA